MRVPLEITFRNVNKTDAIENLIREKAAKLEDLHEGIISCRISVEQPQEHQNTGNQYRVRIGLRVPPGKELVARREIGGEDMHEGIRTVILDAFKTMRRQLRKLKEKQQGNVKTPAADMSESAVVVRIFPEKGFGFLKTTLGREVYFHQNSVLNNDFDRLEIGTGVRIVVSEGEKGPQTSTLQITDKPGVRAAKTEEPGIEVPEGWKP